VSEDRYIPDHYVYYGNDGAEYHGRAGYILNYLDSAEAGLEQELEGRKYTEQTEQENELVALHQALGHLLERPNELARLL
jgi:hypothetical protein